MARIEKFLMHTFCIVEKQVQEIVSDVLRYAPIQTMKSRIQRGETSEPGSFLLVFRTSPALDMHETDGRGRESVYKTRSRRRNFCDQRGIGECPNKPLLAKWIARSITCPNV